MFGSLERELIYYRDRKRCAVCRAEVVWVEADIHHVEEHVKGGPTALENGALVHRHCHPKGSAAAEFVKTWRKHLKGENGKNAPGSEKAALADDEDDEDGGQ